MCRKDQINKAAILITVHNRKDKTINCLTNLYISINNFDQAIIFDVYLVDDGSTDGTREAVNSAFPQVRLVKGDGNLYWCRGMLTAWKHALSNDDYDGFFWVNNDVYLYPDAMKAIFSAISTVEEPSIISGAVISEKTGKTTFGGKVNNKVLTPNGQLQNFEQLNGNFVFIPMAVVKKIGLLDKTFHHGIGDYDYGYRALKAGFRLYLASCHVGICEKDSNYHIFRDPDIPLAKRFRFLYSPLGPPPFALFRFNFRHFSFFKALFIFIYTNMVCLFPGIRSLILKNKHSA